MTTNYEERLIVPITKTTIDLFTAAGTKIATGYTRIVIGGRGPYVEFDDQQILVDKLIIPYNQEHRLNSTFHYYVEFRTRDEASVKVYLQKRKVTYADYVIGMYYISPFDLYLYNGDVLIKKLKSK